MIRCFCCKGLGFILPAFPSEPASAARIFTRRRRTHIATVRSQPRRAPTASHARSTAARNRSVPAVRPRNYPLPLAQPLQLASTTMLSMHVQPWQVRSSTQILRRTATSAIHGTRKCAVGRIPLPQQQPITRCPTPPAIARVALAPATSCSVRYPHLHALVTWHNSISLRAPATTQSQK